MNRYLAWIDTPLNKQIEMVEHLKYAGVLVPVEPEQAYRAALAAVYRAGKPWTKIDNDMQISDRTWEDLVKVAVDAAWGAGVGGE